VTSPRRISYGVALPHRSTEPIAPEVVATVARRAEELGFRDVWVTENTVDPNFSFDPFVVLTYAAAVTRSIRLAVAVVVLPVRHPIHVAHQVASLDWLSNGRALLGVGLGRPPHYADFAVPMERRVARFTESLRVLRELWAGPAVTLEGEFYRLQGVTLGVRPVQRPVPVWLGGDHFNAIRRAARLGDGWISGGGGGTKAEFAHQVTILKESLAAAGRDPDQFPISKRLFVAIDEDRSRARAMLETWFGTVYRDAAKAETHGIYGGVEEVREQIEAFAAAGATHLLLNPVTRYEEQLERVADVVRR